MKPGTATPPLLPTISDLTTCRGSRATIRTSATGSTCRTARWKACSSWARIPLWRAQRALQRTAMSRLKWLVVRDMVEVESASWWYNSPEVEARRTEAGDDRDRSVPFPAAGSAEKEGCQTNTQRLVQFARQGCRSSGRRSQRFLVHASSGAAAESESCSRSKSAQRRLNALAVAYTVHGIHDEPNLTGPGF
jgi:anaerobic selenocysteine-containing dehydrogenase